MVKPVGFLGRNLPVGADHHRDDAQNRKKAFIHLPHVFIVPPELGASARFIKNFNRRRIRNSSRGKSASHSDSEPHYRPSSHESVRPFGSRFGRGLGGL